LDATALCRGGFTFIAISSEVTVHGTSPWHPILFFSF
jgi:hypothetical protein